MNVIFATFFLQVSPQLSFLFPKGFVLLQQVSAFRRDAFEPSSRKRAA